MTLLRRHILAIEELLRRASEAGDPDDPDLAEVRQRLEQLRALAFVRENGAFFRGSPPAQT
ncbi:MAG: hypothetical protein HY722_03090 [Planctomycetes bacterium]|nr:hypothetical protein [Planctomycetota bacterium]